MGLGYRRYFRPWRRVLCLGDRGSKVRELQASLARLGFYPAAPDGVFGYLTQDAVERLQKEFGLTIDGIAGPQVQRLLAKAGPRKLCLHTQTQSDGEPRRIATLLIGYVASDAHILLDQFSQTGRELSALAFDWYNLGDPAGAEKEPSEKLQALAAAVKSRYLPVVTNVSPDDPLEGTRTLANRHLTGRLRERIRRVLSRGDVMGIMLRLGTQPAAINPEIRRLLRDTAQAIRESDKLLLVTVPDWRSPVNNLWGLPWSKALDYVDYLVLEAKPPDDGASLLSLAELKNLIPKWVKKVPPWQLVMEIPLGGVVAGQGRLPYNAVRTLAYRKKAVIQWDQESMSPMYSYQEVGEDAERQEVSAWFENGESLSQKLAVLQRYKIAGLLLSPLGYEDGRTWEVIKRECIVGHL